jgi:hypothetical protein
MEDIFLILIGLLWLAYTFYSRSQKKQRRATRPAETATQSKKEPSILEQILMGQDISIPEPEEYELEPDETEEETFPEFTYSDGADKQEPFLSHQLKEHKGVRSVFSDHVTGNSPLEVEHLDFFSTPGFFDEEFDLRNAVIYQAILDPPYID